MKRIFLFTLPLMLYAISAMTQSPEAFNYQAVARDANGEVLSDQPVGFQISLLQGSILGMIVYSETHHTNTNAFGLVNLQIGNGTLVSGDFSAIDWGGGPYFVQIEMDATGGSDYELLGTSQLLSVPYALHAKNAENISTKYQIGDLAHGGIVFWVDETGKNGLVSASFDQGDQISWANAGYFLTNATGDGIGAGLMNTMLILAVETINDASGAFAAKLCADLVITDTNGEVYGDWYLPSDHELNLMYTNLHLAGLGNFDNFWYWSSTELNSLIAYALGFHDGTYLSGDKGNIINVRAVRAF